MPSSWSRASRAIWTRSITKTASSSKRTTSSSRSNKTSIRISCSRQAQVLAAQAALIYAKNELVRYSKLVKQDAATQTTVDEYVYKKASAEAQLLGAQAQVALAKLNLIYTEVRAPFDGIVGKHLIDPGNVVGGGGQQSALAEITQIDRIYVVA